MLSCVEIVNVNVNVNSIHRVYNNRQTQGDGPCSVVPVGKRSLTLPGAATRRFFKSCNKKIDGISLGGSSIC